MTGDDDVDPESGIDVDLDVDLDGGIVSRIDVDLESGVDVDLESGILSGIQSSDSFLRAVAATSLRAGQVAQLGRAGAKLGGYVLGERIGAGGMGIVHRATSADGRQVAVKVLRRRDGDTLAARRRFLREARVALGIQHPNVARVLECGEEGEETFIAMELLEGETLRERLARAPLGVAEAARLCAGIARGVAAAHDALVIHRDLKPENVVLEAGDVPKVLDFGLARWITPEGAPAPASVLTGLGDVVGTVGYMSPEQGRGRTVGPPTDVFALGVVLFEALAGRRPFVGRGAADVFLAVACDEPPQLRELRGDVPEKLASLVRAMLEKDPSRRPSASAVARELDEIVQTAARG